MAQIKRDWLFYCALFNMCRAVGVLPVKRNAHVEETRHIGESGQDCFSVSIWSRLVTVVHLSIVVFFALSVCPSMIHLNADSFLWVQNFISAITSLLLILLSKSDNLVEYVSSACKIYSLPTPDSNPFPILLFCILIIYPFIPLLYLSSWMTNMTYVEAFYHFKKYYNYIPVAAVEVVITTCCYIARRAYCDINTRLKNCVEVKLDKSTFDAVLTILSEYIMVCKFARCFAVVFSPHFLNTFVYLILRIIFFTVAFIHVIKHREYMILISNLFYAGYLIFRFLIVCFSCQNIHKEIAETIYTVRRLRVSWAYSISEDQSKLLDAYEELISATTVEFTACGLFPVNTQQVVTVLGLIVTYGLVALQN